MRKKQSSEVFGQDGKTTFFLSISHDRANHNWLHTIISKF